MQKLQQETPIKDISHTIGNINFHLPILLDSEMRVRMRMVGDIFTIPFENKIIQLQVLQEPKDFRCHGCFFEDKTCFVYDHHELLGRCSEIFRMDGISVIFKEIAQNQEA